jgi:thiol-disulfide isomerase/thioredoxin
VVKREEVSRDFHNWRYELVKEKGDKMMQRKAGLLVFAVLVGLLGTLAFSSISRVYAIQAPEIVSPTWLNSEPLQLDQLRGKVVMVEFWTFGCWNCRNIEPYVKEWHEKYAKQGLVVIAVHSPEFKYEYDVEKVKDYIREHRIPYAVPIDNEFQNWRQYRNRYWPTLYVIDKKGTIQYTRVGEGGYRQTEEIIQRLLAEPA